MLAWQFLMRWPSSQITTSGPGLDKALSIPGGMGEEDHHEQHATVDHSVRSIFKCPTFEQFLLPVLLVQVDDHRPHRLLALLLPPGHKALLQRQEAVHLVAH